LDYGNLKGFNLELKVRLEEARLYNLGLRLSRSKGLQVLHSYGKGAGVHSAWRSPVCGPLSAASEYFSTGGKLFRRTPIARPGWVFPT
jgi:hypothetical protein